MTDISYKLYDSSSNFVDITPDLGSKESGSKISNLNRTPLGNLYLHSFSTFKLFKFKYSLFPSSSAAVVNSWFDSRQLCQLEIIDELSTNVFSVQFLNKSSPFDEYLNAEMIYLTGKIELAVY